VSLRTLLIRLGLMQDPEEKKRDEELKAKLREANSSITHAQRKIAEASVRTVRNNRRLVQTMSGASEQRNKNVLGSV
jgi:hypothetical protein